MSFVKHFLYQHHIILKKGENLHIITTLILNWILALRLRLYKWLIGIHHPIVHYYAVCWNEEKILPFVLSYYSKFVDKIIIYDNCSDDNSVDVINSFPSTKVIEYETNGFNDLVQIKIKNNCWKKSRGRADYVIVCDIDELIYHDDICNELRAMKSKGYTIAHPFGFNMYSINFPLYSPDILITSQIRRGIRHAMMDKCILFDPHAIVEINYKPGAHECYPLGKNVTYNKPDLKLLHYKFIGLEQFLSRNRMYVERLSNENIENDYGTPYLRSEDLIISEFYEHEQQASIII